MFDSERPCENPSFYLKFFLCFIKVLDQLEFGICLRRRGKDRRVSYTLMKSTLLENPGNHRVYLFSNIQVVLSYTSVLWFLQLTEMFHLTFW